MTHRSGGRELGHLGRADEARHLIGREQAEDVVLDALVVPEQSLDLRRSAGLQNARRT